MYDLNKTIKHFQSLQKRYTKTHQGEACERVADALEALNFYKGITGREEKLFGKWYKITDKDKV